MTRATAIAPYGAWVPPVDARTVASRAGRPAFPAFVGDEARWTEPRPAVTCLDAELSLYGQVFGFTPPAVPRLELST